MSDREVRVLGKNGRCLVSSRMMSTGSLSHGRGWYVWTSMGVVKFYAGVESVAAMICRVYG